MLKKILRPCVYLKEIRNKLGEEERFHERAEDQAFTVTSVAVQLLMAQLRHYFPFLHSEPCT